MKTRNTTRSLLNVSLLVILSCQVCTQAVGPSFFDDFSDGDPLDGSPVSWIPDYSNWKTGYQMTNDGMLVSSVGAADASGNAYEYLDVSMTTHVGQGNWNEAVGIALRWNQALYAGYCLDLAGPNRLAIWRVNSPSNMQVLKNTTVASVNLTEQDVMMRMEIIGDTISAWCWPAGEPMPAAPLISVTDTRYTAAGTVANYATGAGKVLIRSTEVVSLDSPVVDFNGDGQVDIEDLLGMIQHWGQNEPSVDLNGDGTVGENDLEILMECWGKDVEDHTLKAHWALDEEQGAVARDSAGVNDAYVIGEPVWEATGGQVNGAIQLDGADDVVIAGPTVNPAGGPFSVLAWIRGGAAGQVVISEPSGANWLGTGPLDGFLMTELTSDGRSAAPLLSETTIADGNWHRIGFVWDGADRTLYVDGVAVAQDMQNGLKSSSNGLYIGASKAMASGTYWSGLIDDIRIYNRAVRP